MYHRRLANEPEPWTADPILRAYRFTNTYRVADRVSQYLIREVQYHPSRSQEPREIFFRTILFKLFNKIETWEALERAHGTLEWRTVDLDALDETLTRRMAQGFRNYSAAYIMPSPSLGLALKHSNHLRLLAQMMRDHIPDRVRQAQNLETVYSVLRERPGLGAFLAFQYAIDLNYSEMLDFEEADFVVAGPGALDGISKCFRSLNGKNPEQIIRWMTDRQEVEMRARGISFQGLFGRPLQPIDCQNLFCEISKYARVAHPEYSGVAKRTRIKQSYRPLECQLSLPFFPPRWGLTVPKMASASQDVRPRQAQLI